MTAIYFAGRFWHMGEHALIYDSPPAFFGAQGTPAWHALRDALGHPGEFTFPYIYPPIWAAVFAPLAGVIDPMTFFRAAYAVQIAMIAASILLAWRIMGRPTSAFAWSLASVLLIGVTVIGNHALFHNQPQITVAFLTLLAFERLSAGREVQGGIALGLAAAVKLTPVLLIVLFLVDRRWRGAAACLATSGGLAILSLIVAGPDLHRTFLDQLGLISSQVVITETNYSLRSLLWAGAQILAGTPPDTTEALTLAPAPAWLTPATFAVLVGGGALILSLTRDLPPDRRLAHRLPALLILTALTAPLGWAHHYLAALLLLPGLLALRPFPRNLILLGGLAVVLSSPVLILLRPDGPLGRLVPVSIAVAVLVLVALAFTLMRPAQRS